MKTPEFVLSHRKAAGLRTRPFRVKVPRKNLEALIQTAIPREIATLIAGKTLWCLKNTIGSVMVFPPPNDSYWGPSPWYLPKESFSIVKNINRE